MRQAPDTWITLEEAEELVRVLRAMPANVGFALNHCLEPSHTPAVFNGYSAIVVLPGTNSRGEAMGDNAAKAIFKAWSLASLDAAEKLRSASEARPEPKEWR